MTGRVAAPSRDQLSSAFLFDGTSWTAAQATNLHNSVNDLSCGSPTMCVLTSYEGSVSEWNGVSWSTSAPLGSVYVSCVSATFCMGVWGGSAAVYDGTTWSAATTIDTNWVDSVACAATDFCVAADDNGEDNGVTLAN